MRFLIDEMFHGGIAERLRVAGHDAVHVGEIGMAGVEDADIVERSAAENRVVVTENAADFVALLDARTAAGLTAPPVIIALKRTMPRGAGAMSHHLAERLDAWAQANPDPYRHVHWLGASS